MKFISVIIALAVESQLMHADQDPHVHRRQEERGPLERILSHYPLVNLPVTDNTVESLDYGPVIRYSEGIPEDYGPIHLPNIRPSNFIGVGNLFIRRETAGYSANEPEMANSIPSDDKNTMPVDESSFSEYGPTRSSPQPARSINNARLHEGSLDTTDIETRSR